MTDLILTLKLTSLPHSTFHEVFNKTLWASEGIWDIEAEKVSQPVQASARLEDLSNLTALFSSNFYTD